MGSLVSVTVEMPPFEAVKRLERSMSSVYRNAGQHLARCIRRHMRLLSAARRSPDASGPPHFKPADVLEPIVTTDGVQVSITTPGISRAYHDIDIYPKEANALAIPLHASAYGMAPREINDRGLYQMFRIKKNGIPGNVLYRNEDDHLIPMYALVQHVHQTKDPSLMPSDEELIEAATAGAESAIRHILR